MGAREIRWWAVACVMVSVLGCGGGEPTDDDAPAATPGAGTKTATRPDKARPGPPPKPTRPEPPSVDPEVARLIGVLDSGTAPERQKALTRLWILGPKSTPAIPKLIGLLGSTEGRDALIAKNTLIKLGPAAVPHLQEALAAADAARRPPIERVAIELTHRHAAGIPLLIPLIRDDGQPIEQRERAIRAVGASMGAADPAAAAPLIAMLAPVPPARQALQLTLTGVASADQATRIARAVAALGPAEVTVDAATGALRGALVGSEWRIGFGGAQGTGDRGLSLATVRKAIAGVGQATVADVRLAGRVDLVLKRYPGRDTAPALQALDGVRKAYVHSGRRGKARLTVHTTGEGLTLAAVRTAVPGVTITDVLWFRPGPTARDTLRLAVLRALKPAAGRLTGPLLDALEGDSDPRLHRAVALLLAEGRSADGVDRLRALLRRTPLDHRAALAARILGAVGPPAAGAVHDLIDVLENAQPTAARKEAGAALVRVGPGETRVTTAVTTAARKDEDQGVRQGLLLALPGLDDKPAAVKVLTEALGSQTLTTVYAAARALKTMGRDAAPAVPALIKAMKGVGGALGTASVICDVLGNIGPDAKAAVPMLEQYAKSPHYRGMASRALSRIGR